jgi:hypothetical protein
LYDDENIYTIFPPEYGYPNVLKIWDDELDIENNMLIKDNIMYCFSKDNYYGIYFDDFPIMQEDDNIRILQLKNRDIFYLYIWCKQVSLWLVSPNTVYRDTSSILKDVDIENIELIWDHYLKIYEDIYIDNDYKHLWDAVYDFDTFEHIEWNFYRDKKNIYYILRKLYWLKWDNLLVLENDIITDSIDSYYQLWQIENPYVDIQKLWKSFFKNEDDIYFRSLYGNISLDLDIDSYQILWNWLIKDNEVVYYGNSKMGLNPSTVRNFNWGYFWDDKSIFLGLNKINGIDATTFQSFIFAKHIARDKDNIYYWNKKMNSVDADTFEVLNYYFAADKNNLYLLWWVIELIHWLNQDNLDIEVLTSKSIKYENRIYTINPWRTLMINGEYQPTDKVE